MERLCWSHFLKKLPLIGHQLFIIKVGCRVIGEIILTSCVQIQSTIRVSNVESMFLMMRNLTLLVYNYFQTFGTWWRAEGTRTDAAILQRTLARLYCIWDSKEIGLLPSLPPRTPTLVTRPMPLPPRRALLIIGTISLPLGVTLVTIPISLPPLGTQLVTRPTFLLQGNYESSQISRYESISGPRWVQSLYR